MIISGKEFHINLHFWQLMLRFWQKLIATFRRLLDVARLLPIRLGRLGQHIWKGMRQLWPSSRYWWEPEISSHALVQIRWWFSEFFLYLLDCLGFGELYESIMDFVKFNTRPLHPWEKTLAKECFGHSIRYWRVRIDEYALLGPRQKRFCYVGFYTINSWGPMQNSLLLHELTHIWQYERMGAVYMPKSLRAQASQMGYNYGGVSTLKAYLEKGKGFLALNLEQQADLVSDYHLIKSGYSPRWGQGRREDLHIYEAFIKQLNA